MPSFSNDQSGVRVKPEYSKVYFLFAQHFRLRNLPAPPLTVSNLITWLIVEIAVWGMFDSSNALIVTLSPMFSIAFNGLKEIHAFDLYHLLVSEVAHSFFEFPFTITPSNAPPALWSGSQCKMSGIYSQYLGKLPFDYIHHRRIPTGKLAEYFASVTPDKSYKRGLKLLRMYRVLVQYCHANNLLCERSYRASIFKSDHTLFQIFNVKKFHSMDLPYLLLNHSRPFVKSTIAGQNKNVC